MKDLIYLLLRYPGKVIRKLRTIKKGWSLDKDMRYHDSLFSKQNFEPFTFSYMGYVTIRRFADLVSPYVEGISAVIDLGCGCGEITCELAGRYPNVRFIGVDHSEKGILRAREHAKRLRLRNTDFEVANVEDFEPRQKVDIILMFDSFHHLENPAPFIQRMSCFSLRFALIEPRGDWKGSWVKDLDFDWLVTEMEKIRERIAYLTRENERMISTTLEATQVSPDVAVEHRYSLKDFESFLKDFTLNVRGTVAGIGIYPPDPHRPSQTRKHFGQLTYELIREIDDVLFERNIDLLAKHWVIYAERGGQNITRNFPENIPEIFQQAVLGPYDVEYISYVSPRTASIETDIIMRLTVKNRGWKIWSSYDSENPFFVSYHWLDSQGRVIIHDGKRSALPKALGQGEECDMDIHIKTPSQAGQYILAIDLVHEGITWFSQAGSPSLRIDFRVY